MCIPSPSLAAPRKKVIDLMMNENSSVIVALCSHLCMQGCKPLEPSEWTSLADKLISLKMQPKDIQYMSDAQMRDVLGFSEAQTERIKRLFDRSVSIGFELQRYNSMGIKVVTRADAEYPIMLKRRLKGGCPPLFYYAGDIGLASRPLAGFVGSRNIDEDDARFAERTVDKVNALGYGVVSGGARGVDSVSAARSLANGNVCVEYVADALLRKIKKREAIVPIQDGRMLALFAMKPDAGFTGSYAMTRNKYIYANSQGTIVVKSDYMKGGTWGGATNALKKELCTVFCRELPQSYGNTGLIQQGAVPINDYWSGDVTAVSGFASAQGTQLNLFE